MNKKINTVLATIVIIITAGCLSGAIYFSEVKNGQRELKSTYFKIENKTKKGTNKVLCAEEGQATKPYEELVCCDGAKYLQNYIISENDNCVQLGEGVENHHICINCGDNICGKGENKCNCPQDCKDFKCTGHGEIPRYTNPEDDMSIQCCNGLIHRTQKEYCGEDGLLGYYGICLSCGDGICDKNVESKCNCPEDCK